MISGKLIKREVNAVKKGKDKVNENRLYNPDAVYYEKRDKTKDTKSKSTKEK